MLLDSVVCTRTKAHSAWVLLLQLPLHDSVIGEHAGSVGPVMRLLILLTFVSCLILR